MLAISFVTDAIDAIAKCLLRQEPVVPLAMFQFRLFSNIPFFLEKKFGLVTLIWRIFQCVGAGTAGSGNRG